MTAHGGCFSFLKFLVFTVNFLLWLVGLGVLGVSLWLLFDSDLYLQTSADQKTDYYLATYILLGVGALVSIMGFLGCCGAWKQSAWMLGTFFAFLLIIFFIEIGFGIMVYFKVLEAFKSFVIFKFSSYRGPQLMNLSGKV